MIPIAFVEVCQEPDLSWPCPCCTANESSAHDLYDHLAEHPTGPYYLFRSVEGIVEIPNISNALVLPKEWGVGEGEVYWLVDDACSACGHNPSQNEFAVECCCCSKLYCLGHFPKKCKLTRLIQDPPIDYMVVCPDCAAGDKRLFDHAFLLREMRRFHTISLVPISIKAAKDNITVYSISVTGSKGVTYSKKYGYRAYETRQHNKITPCLEMAPAPLQQRKQVKCSPSCAKAETAEKSPSNAEQAKPLWGPVNATLAEEDFEVVECPVCEADIVSRTEGDDCRKCSLPCHISCMGGPLRTLRGNTSTYYPEPVCNACTEAEEELVKAAAEKAAAEKAAAEKAAAEAKAVADRQAAETAAAEAKAVAVAVAFRQAAAEKAAAEKAAPGAKDTADRLAEAEKAAAEARATADRLATEAQAERQRQQIAAADAKVVADRRVAEASEGKAVADRQAEALAQQQSKEAAATMNAAADRLLVLMEQEKAAADAKAVADRQAAEALAQQQKENAAKYPPSARQLPFVEREVAALVNALVTEVVERATAGGSEQERQDDSTESCVLYPRMCTEASPSRKSAVHRSGNAEVSTPQTKSAATDAVDDVPVAKRTRTGMSPRRSSRLQQ